MISNKKKYFLLLLLGIIFSVIGTSNILSNKYFISSLPFNSGHRNESSLTILLLGITLMIISLWFLFKKNY